MKKLLIFISLLITTIFLVTCFTQEQNDIEPVDEMMTFKLNNLNNFVDISVENGRTSAIPDDQDTLYIEFRLYESQIKPAFLYKLSPIPEVAEFKLPLYTSGYDIMVSTMPNKYFRFKEGFNMKKHLWTWFAWDVGDDSHWGRIDEPISDVEVDVQLERHSTNFIIRGKQGTNVPTQVNSSELKLFSVFDNYAIKDGNHYGWYEDTVINLSINPDRTIEEIKTVVMGMKDPFDSLGTFMFTTKNEPGFGWRNTWQTYKYKLVYIGGKTTILEINLEHLGNRDWQTPITWIDEEEEIIIPAG